MCIEWIFEWAMWTNHSAHILLLVVVIDLSKPSKAFRSFRKIGIYTNHHHFTMHEIYIHDWADGYFFFFFLFHRHFPMETNMTEIEMEKRLNEMRKSEKKRKSKPKFGGNKRTNINGTDQENSKNELYWREWAKIKWK